MFCGGLAVSLCDGLAVNLCFMMVFQFVPVTQLVRWMRSATKRWAHVCARRTMQGRDVIAVILDSMDSPTVKVATVLIAECFEKLRIHKIL